MTPVATSAERHDAELAARDPALPGVAVLLDGDLMAELLAAACPDAGIGGAVAEYVRYKPGDSCLVAYEFDAAGGPLPGYARCQRHDDLAKLGKARKRVRAQSAAGPGGVLIPPLGIAIYLFPNDRRLHSLHLLGAAGPRRELLERVLPGRPGIPEGEITRLRYKPERRFVAAVEGADGSRAVLRVYGDTFERCSATARAIRPGGALRVPERLGKSSRDGALALEWLPGRPLAELLPGVPAGVLRSVGAALAELHRLPPERVADGEPDEGGRVGAAAAAAAVALPGLADRLERLAARLAARLESARRTPVHGDFSADQVLVDGDEVAVVDLDRAERADPGGDLASFAAALELESLAGRLEPPEAEAAVAGVVAGYGAAGGPGRLTPARIAAALVRLAPEPFRSRAEDWPQLTAALVERAEELADA